MLMQWRAVPLAIIAILFSMTATRAKTICTAVADAANHKVLLHEGDCDHRVTPASTFKIAISLMGYDSGFLADEHHPMLPFREGYVDWIPEWRQTTDPTSWIKYSVVWFSQQVTQSLGEARFRKYVDGFHYGNRDVSGDPGKHNGLTRAWLSSSLKISPMEEISFLEGVVNRKLPVSSHAFDMTGQITQLAVLPGGWEIHGKTGTGSPPILDVVYDGAPIYGWFVGWAIRGPRTLVFTRLIEDEKIEPGSAGSRARDSFLKELPSLLDSLAR
jgi:beta-lactamase class D